MELWSNTLSDGTLEHGPVMEILGRKSEVSKLVCGVISSLHQLTTPRVLARVPFVAGVESDG